MAMQFMRAIEVPETPRDLLFRASRLRGILFVAATLAVCAALIFKTFPPPRIIYFIVGLILFLLSLFHRMIAARFHPQNWLARVSDNGVFIHYRSFLNERMSVEDPTVVLIPFADIRSARLIRERVTTPDPMRQNTSTTQFLRWIELELAADPAPLLAALDAESGRPGIPERRWYGTSTTVYRDYPVLMQSPPFLRLKWQVVPGPSAFLDTLRPHVQIAPEVRTTEEFSSLQGLSRAEQEKRLRQLDQRGETIAAVYIATKLYKLNLSQAENFVHALRGGSQP